MIDLDKINLDEMQGTKLSTPTFVKYAEAKEGDILVTGIYRGEFPNKFNADKPNHKFETKGRKMIVLPSAGQLDYFINENIEVGDLVRVTYMGKEEMSEGTYKGRPVNTFEVELLIAGDEEKPAQAVQAKEEPVQDSKQNTDLNNLE